MGEIEVIKKELLDNIQNVLKEHEADLDKKYITMDEMKKQIGDLQAKIEQAKVNSKDGKKAFADYIAKIVKGEGLTGDLSSSLVPENVANTILAELQDTWILQDTTVYPDNKGLLFYQGDAVNATWTAVGTAPASVDQQVNIINYNAQRLVVGQPVGAKLAEQAKPAVANFLLQSFKNAFNYALTTAFIKGTGSGQPEGLYSRTDIATYTLGTGNTTIDKITYDDIAEVYFSLPAPYRKKATWYMNTAVLKVIKKLKDNNGLPIFSATDNTIFNRPVREVSDMDSSGATNPVILFGYGKDYYIFTDGKFETAIVRDSLELVQKGQIYIQLTGYFDGKLVTPKHFVGLKLSAS